MAACSTLTLPCCRQQQPCKPSLHCLSQSAQRPAYRQQRFSWACRASDERSTGSDDVQVYLAACRRLIGILALMAQTVSSATDEGGALLVDFLGQLKLEPLTEAATVALQAGETVQRTTSCKFSAK